MTFTPQYPYLIAAPDYRESSLGIQVLHRLCHLINERGGSAWMVGCTVNDEWNAPALTEEAYSKITSTGKPWIAVYPEVTTGNPFSAPVVVRYMLNREGVIMGNGIEAGQEDLFFWYRTEFADKEINAHLLCVEFADLSLFKDDIPIKDKDFLYLNRIPEHAVNFSLLPENVTLLSMSNPLPLRELAKLLKRGRVLYTFESSGTCVLANLCGCPVVALRAPGYEQYALNEQTFKDIGDAGFGYSDSLEELARIRETLPRVREHLLAERRLHEVQLDNFLCMTQEKAQRREDEQYRVSFEGWLTQRSLPEAFVSEPITLLFVILCQGVSESDINLSITSILRQGINPQFIMLVSPSSDAHLSRFNVRYASINEWKACIKRLAEAQLFEWLHCIDAGTEYAPDSIRLIKKILYQAVDLHAVYADEAVRENDGQIISIRNSDFNLDLFLSIPYRSSRRIWFRREGWLASGGFDSKLHHAFEFEMLVNYILQWGTGCIGHVAEVTSIVPANLFNHSCEQEERWILNAYLQKRGYSDAQLIRQNNQSWRLIYQQPKNEIVSILLDAGDNPALLTRCIESVMSNTEWQHKEFLLAINENAAELMHDVVEQLRNLIPLKVVICEVNQSYANRMNQLEKLAAGDYILLLNLHTIMVLKNWLTTLMSHGLRPEVGCVGPKIITKEQSLLSAGIILGAKGWIGHVGQGEAWQSEGNLSRYQYEQNYSALSGNCLLVRREAWLNIGGLPDSYDDDHVIDILASLMLRAAGYVTVWTPFSVVVSDNARLLENVCVSDSKERMELMAEVPQFFAGDPAYNRNLKLCHPLFSTDDAPESWDHAFTDALPCVLLVNSDSQNEYGFRIIELMNMLVADNLIKLRIENTLPTATEILRIAPNSIIFTDVPDETLTSQLKAVRKIIPLREYTLADTRQNPTSSQWKTEGMTRWLTWSHERELQLSKRKLSVARLPILLSHKGFNARKLNTSSRKRVLCIPSGYCEKELEFVGRVIAATHENIDWVIVGEWPKSWIPLVAETVRWQKAGITQTQLHKLQVDAAVIFRGNGDNNRFCDDYLMIQLAASGIAIVASDVSSLRNALPVLRLKADPQQWMRAIECLNEINTETYNAVLDDYRWDPEKIPEIVRELFL